MNNLHAFKLPINVKNIIILVCAIIAALGVYPYAKNFSATIFSNRWLREAGIVLFVLTAFLANIALNAYSLLDTIKVSKELSTTTYLFTSCISLIAAISMGFISFAGYSDTFPIAVNLPFSLIVTFVNAAIGFSAINKVINHFLDLFKLKVTTLYKMLTKDVLQTLLRILIIVGALLVSLNVYFASTNGIISLLNYYHLAQPYSRKAAYVFSIIVWIPNAALFANAAQTTAVKLYEQCAEAIWRLSPLSLAIGLVAIPSGSAYAQMVVTFFDASKHIPPLFQEMIGHQHFILYFLMPLGLIISGLVNNYALTNLVKTLKKKPPH